MADELNPWERETLEVFLMLGHEVAGTALALRAEYVCAHLCLGADDLVVFTHDRRRMTVTGRGFEVDLSRLPEW